MVFCRIIIFIIVLFLSNFLSAFDFTPVRLKYKGGDWYNDEYCLKILAKYINEHTNLKMDTSQIIFSISDKRIMDYPFLFMTGHGGIKYSKNEIDNIKKYLLNGGFLYIDDDYGFNRDITGFLNDLFDDRNVIKLPVNNEIYSNIYKFNNMPKIHEHYTGNPSSYCIFINGKISVLYTFNTNISDGWAIYETHKDPWEKREQALKMGTNIIFYALFR